MHKRESRYLQHSNARASSIGVGLRTYTEQEQATYGAWTNALTCFARRRRLGEGSEAALENAVRESAPVLYTRIQELQDSTPPVGFVKQLRVYLRREKFRRQFRTRLIRLLEGCYPVAKASWDWPS
jgi:hypothetical protein